MIIFWELLVDSINRGFKVYMQKDTWFPQRGVVSEENIK